MISFFLFCRLNAAPSRPPRRVHLRNLPEAIHRFWSAGSFECGASPRRFGGGGNRGLLFLSGSTGKPECREEAAHSEARWRGRNVDGGFSFFNFRRCTRAWFFLPFCLLFFWSVPHLLAAPGFFGWVPLQQIEPGQEFTLDLRRFYEPDSGDELKLPEELPDGLELQLDREKLLLQIRLDPSVRGLIDLPIQVKNGSARRTVVVSIAAQPQALPPDAQLPSAFALAREGGRLSFAVRPGEGAALASVSVVGQWPDGSSRVLDYQLKDKELVVSTEDLPEGAWVRVIVADDRGRVSRAARARTQPTKQFQWQDGVIYYAFTDRFVNGEPANDRPVQHPDLLPQANYFGGDFQGIRQKIEQDYFAKLGVNILWLAPLNRNPDGAWQEYLPPYRFYSGYHGYWPVSHTEIEPRFGGEEGLQELVAAAHRNELKLIADLVLKHSHVEHPLWKEKREWFGTLELPDGSKNLRIWEEQQFTTWFEEWLPGFDFDNPEAVNFLLGNARDWAARFKVDGYRLDAVKHIQYSFWPRFRTTMRDFEKTTGRSPMYFVGETFMDRQGIMSFVGPNMLDGQFDFPLYDTIMEVFAANQAGFPALEASLSASETIYGKETLMSPLVGNHDKSRFMAFADGDLPISDEDDEEEIGWANPPRVDDSASYEKLKLALGFILTIDGVPMIYYGDEVGLTGAGDPDNRRMMPGEAELSPPQLAVRDYFSKVARLRQEHPALRYGNRTLLLADQNRYAFLRRHFEDSVLAVWNKGATVAEFELSSPEWADGTYADLLSGNKITVQQGRVSFSLPALTSAFFTRLP